MCTLNITTTLFYTNCSCSEFFFRERDRQTDRQTDGYRETERQTETDRHRQRERIDQSKANY